MFKITKNDLAGGNYEVEDGIYIIFANDIRDFKKKMYTMATNLTIPLGTSEHHKRFAKSLTK